jgi:CRISPR-associated exonuclease Cas4
MAAFSDRVRLNVTDLKNYVHCPRFPYYEQCLSDVRPRTYLMDAGEEAHERERARARRRTLWQYGLPEGERHFNVRLESATLGLVGVIDELVIAPGARYLPVDYKYSSQTTESFALQIAAYALLLEETHQVHVPQGYIYLLAERKLITVGITAELRQSVHDALTTVRRIVALEAMPPPTPHRARCRACEWRRFCNDVT